MNKKAIDFRTLTFFIAVIIIALLLILFYAWQGIEGKKVEGKIQVASDTVHKNRILINILNHQIDSEKTIGDAIAQNELDEACKEAKKVIYMLYGTQKQFSLEFDDDEFCESENSPSQATKLTAFIPIVDKDVKEVVLEI